MSTQNITSKPAETRRLQMHVISNTHWDREWRQPFQQTRMNLVDVMDQLLEILEKDQSYKFYHLDSQTIVLEDYLRIRPENKSKIEKYITQGRILAGPWYSNPDMNTLTGESIVRNLLMGHSIANSFGRVMKVGYNPFSFGQISQLPQIYAGFGMDVIMFYRGVGRHRAKSEFWWEGADGTRALCSQLSTRTRHNFYYHVYQYVCEGARNGDRQFTWKDIPLPAHSCHSKGRSQSVYALDHKSNYRKELISEGLHNLIEEDEGEFTTEHFLLMQGCDTTAPNPLEPQLILDCDKTLLDCDVFHSSLEKYAQALKESVEGVNTLHGEMREALRDRGAPCLGDVISARVYLKQENAKSTNQLEMWAEPSAVNAWLMGGDYPDEFLNLAWKYLLANHAHDSISGCSVDAVHEDMKYRFSQVRQIGEEVTRRAQMDIVRLIDGSVMRESESLVTVFNPLGHERNEVLTVFLDFDADQSIQTFEIVDSMDREIPHQLVSVENAQNTVQLRTDWPKIYDSKRYQVDIQLDHIPAGGYKCLRVRPSGTRNDQADKIQSLRTGPCSMENEFVSVSFAPNGTINLYDKETDRFYRECLFFESSGECGHAWWHISPHEDSTITSLGSQAEISILQEGPVRCTICSKIEIKVPAISDENKRGSETVKIPIENRVTLYANHPRIDIQTVIDNTARNHRLRVCFPTHLQAQYSAAESAFDVVERPIRKINRRSWRENFGYTHPKLSFIDISDGQAGFAFIGDGISEYEVIPNPSRTLAITLLRAFEGRRKGFGFPASENESPQCLGKHEFSYALYLHSGQWNEANVIVHGHNHKTGLTAIQSARPSGVLPMEHSFWRLEPNNITLSCIKQSQDQKSVILRLFNPTSEQIDATLHTNFRIKRAFEVSMEEVILHEIDLRDSNKLIFKIGAKKVMTFSLVFDRQIFEI